MEVQSLRWSSIPNTKPAASPRHADDKGFSVMKVFIFSPAPRTNSYSLESRRNLEIRSFSGLPRRWCFKEILLAPLAGGPLVFEHAIYADSTEGSQETSDFVTTGGRQRR